MLVAGPFLLALWGLSGPSPAPPPGPRLLALLVDNLSGQVLPEDALQAEWEQALQRHGATLVPGPDRDAFMARHRIRWTGGISGDHADAARQETGAEAVAILSVETYVEEEPPRMAALGRVVRAGADLEILGFAGAAATGEDTPGLFDMGVVRDPAVIRGRVLEALAGAVLRGREDPPPSPERRFGPRSLYVRPEGPVDTGRTAVFPFTNHSTRRHAGDILALHVARQLWARTGLRLVEPGEVRKFMLDARVVQEGGLSLAQTDLVRDLLEVSLAVTGSVEDYLEVAPPAAASAVTFNAIGIDVARRQVSWSAAGYERGSAGVFFFDRGLVRTAHDLADEMIGAAVAKVYPPRGRREPRKERRAP